MTTADPIDIEVIRRILYTHTGYLGADDTPVEAFNRLLAELYNARSRAMPQLPRGWIIWKLQDFATYATCELHELDDAGRKSKGEGQSIFAVRTSEGRARAVERGVKLGRKKKLDEFQKREAIKRRDTGEPVRDIARTYNVSHSTISRL